MPYPRLLNLGEEVEQELKTFLNQEIFNLQAERGRFIDQLKEYQKIYWSEPKEGKVTFPFHNASKLVIPLSAISIETIHARNMNTLFGLPNLISCKAQIPEFVSIEHKFGNWFDKELKKNCGIKQFAQDTDLERVKYGNCVGRASYVYEVKRAIKYVGDEETEFDVVTRNGAVLEAVPVSRFLLPFTDVNPQRARLVGEERELTEFELRLKEASGEFYEGTIDKLKAYFDSQSGAQGAGTGEFTEQQRELERKVPTPFPTSLTHQHLWLAFNTDKDPENILKEIIVDYHYESSTIMSVRYNWYEDLHRPYRIGKYFPIEHRWTGVGVCKQLMEFQKEITVQHRQRIDNATLANTRMIKISKLSGYGPNEPIFPGKMWFVDEMDHIDVLQMGEIYNSAFNNEQSSLMYAQQRSGVDELSLGMQQAGTPEPATNNINRVQEGRGKHAYFFNNFKDFLNEIIIDAACVIQQYWPRDLEILDRDPNGALIRSVLTLPHEYIRSGLAFELEIVGANNNKEKDKQAWLQLGQVSQQYWSGLLQLAQMAGAPQLMGSIVLRAITSATEAMRQIYESFDIRNIDRLIMMESIQNGLNQLLEQGGIGGSPGTQQTQGSFSYPQIVPPNSQSAGARI